MYTHIIQVTTVHIAIVTCAPFAQYCVQARAHLASIQHLFNIGNIQQQLKANYKKFFLHSFHLLELRLLVFTIVFSMLDNECVRRLFY